MEVLWSRPLRLRSSPTAVAATSDALVVAERHSRLVRLDPSSGALLWDQRVEDCWGTTVVAEERCLYLSQMGVLHCFDLHSGRRMWSTPGLRFHRYASLSGAVILLGGWRGYHPLMRVDLADGMPAPYDSPYAPGDSLAWPLPLRLMPEPNSAADAVLLASASRPELRLLDTRTGVDLGAWPLPAPVRFPDSGHAYRLGDDGRIVFISGRRTVMAFRPAIGVEILWQHERDLPPLAPVLSEGRLLLAEDACITVVDLIDGSRTEVTSLSPGASCAPVPIPGGALFARSDGNLVRIDRAGGIRARVRLPTRIDQLFTAGSYLAHTIGKGHLTTLNVPSM
ncbi:PQQ-binding-like beta-propeller repeat protein [Dactylosporangium sp. CA-233914]|uniref:outer membrane protein assembly factor BamB family protein n=1 Tax=Dactylosporangium sp. CA-233914 TaxID=3239934 RepID=UPI003D8DB704